MADDLLTQSASRAPAGRPMVDSFGRKITYIRLSVTDRCDLRCTYCMPELMQFLPKSDVLSLEEMLAVSNSFIARGVDRIRLTGGEPLVRKNILWLIEQLGAKVKAGDLREITITTNGTQLADMAADIAHAGVQRLNISLDTLKPATFKDITRRNSFDDVMRGIEAAKSAGMAVKINSVLVKGVNGSEAGDLIRWAAAEGLDLTFIETMPMGADITQRGAGFVSLMALMEELQPAFDLRPSNHATGGPARYYDIGTSGQRLGLITPLSNNFCAGCNRVRITCTGRIYMCLGQDDHLDLRKALREDGNLDQLLDKALFLKPEGHDFAVSDREMKGTVARHMSHTGG